jgi:hypothetical protein
MAQPRSQFTIRRMMVAVAVVGAACWTGRQFHLSRHYESRAYHEAICWAITLASAAVLRWPGAWAGPRLGIVARHAVGWFTAFVGAAIAVLLMILVESEHIHDGFGGGLAAAALLSGLIAATIVETVIGSVEYLWPDLRRGSKFVLDVRDGDTRG